MRFAWYAGISTALAASVVVSAFHQRANFYSAMVYLAQSNLCLLVLINFFYLIYGIIMYGLQRLLYGSLRQTEVEQLSEKAWFAITETCLAMTIFREQIGAWFLVMFTALITGKVWGWIGDGRVEILEQQPPTNPGLFHTRLSISLFVSLVYDMWILKYTVNAVIQQARPDMMVMFLFEFAILATTSARTGVRYLVSVLEHRIIREQTQKRLAERRQEIREEREEILRQREQSTGDEQADTRELPSEDDVDEMDIEVPGWENKGQWILLLDLVADCTKLSIYVVFFFILFSFYGLPIHIMRDLFMTGRAVIKRGTALWKYRRAMEDMNKYADATAEDIAREDTCIICREDMRPWDPVNNPAALQRIRPKKLPCGHILHMGCLKSWLERQQVCPTCRRSVVISDPANAANRGAVLQRVGLGGLGVPQAPAQPGQPQPQAHRPGQAAPAQPNPQPGHGGARVFNFGGLRVGFAQGGENIQQLAQRMGQLHPAAQAAAAPQVHPQDQPGVVPTPAPAAAPNDMNGIREQLQELERSLQRQVQTLQQDQQQLQLINLLFAEIQRLRLQQQDHTHDTHNMAAFPPQPQYPYPPGQWPLPQPSRSTLSRHGVAPNTTTIPAGSPDLPEGVIIPAGWSLMPLQRLDGSPAQQPQSTVETAASGAGTPAAPGPLAGDEQPPGPSSVPGPSDAPGGSDGASSAALSAETAAQPPQPREPSPLRNGTSSHPEILAPNPVMPNWGGENQLFGGTGGDASVPSSRDTSVAAEAATRKEHSEKTSSLEASTRLTTDEEVDRDAGKGKARAVTVEDAGEEEET